MHPWHGPTAFVTHLNCPVFRSPLYYFYWIFIELKYKRNILIFCPGDVIGVAGNHWDGFNKGRNHRSNRIGLYPEYKTSEQIKVVDFPNYAHVDL